MNKIELISYNLKNNIESYYLAYLETLPVLKTIDKKRNITSIQITASTKNGKYLDEQVTKAWQTLGDLNLFFEKNHSYFIDDLQLELNNNLKISSHDNGEIHFEFPTGSQNEHVLIQFLKDHNISEAILNKAKYHKGEYLQLGTSNTIVARFSTFDAYVKSLNKSWQIEATPYPFVAPIQFPTILKLNYDLYQLNVTYEVSPGQEYNIVFQNPTAFKIMEERDLGRFWQYKIITDNSLFEITQGGMLTREKEDSFISDQIQPLKEFFLKGSDESLFVLCKNEPVVTTIEIEK